MKRLTCLFFLFCLFFGGCSGKRQKENEEKQEKKEIGLTPPYSVDLEKVLAKEEPFSLSEIAKQIDCIPLETSSDILLKRVHQYLFYNDQLLVTDFSHLHAFTSEGKHIKKIGNKGSGPADYNYVNTLIKDDALHHLYLLTSGKMIVYDQQADFITSRSFQDKSIRGYTGLMTGPDKFLIYLGSTFKKVGDTSTIYSFAEVDTSGRVIRQIPNASPIESTFNGMIVSPIPFYKYEDRIHYMDYGNDTLKVITNEGANETYAICSLGHMKREVNTAGFSEQQIEELSSKLLVYRICEDKNYLYITLIWGASDNFQYVLFDKRTGETKNIGNKGIVNDLNGGVNFFPQQIEEDGTMSMWMQAEDFKEQILSSNQQEQKDTYGEKFEQIRQFASQMDEDANPIIIKVKGL